jgi:hypothetical protein
MTIGLIALRAAKEQLVAAIATIKDELKNPELCEQIKFEVYNLGSDFDDHLTELGNAMPRMFTDKTAQVERSNIEEGLHLLDPTQESGLVDGGLQYCCCDGRGCPECTGIVPAEPATDGNPALEPGLDAPAPSPADALAGLKVAHESLGEKIKEIGKEIADGAGNAIGEAKFGD